MKEMMDLYGDIKLKGVNLWTEFTSSFRLNTIKRWNLAHPTSWKIKFIKRDVYVKKGRMLDKIKALNFIL